MTTTQAIEKIIATAKSEVGYLEKKSNSNLDNKTANAGRNNYTKYWRDIKNWGLGNYQAQYWCAAFIFWCFVKTFGLDKAKKLLLHAPYVSCYTAGNLFKNANRLYSEPKAGDIVLFKKSNGIFGHTGIIYKVANGYFYTIEGNTSSAAGVIANGGAVAYKSYSISVAKNSGHKFARPDYSLVATTKNTSNKNNQTNKKNITATGVITEKINKKIAGVYKTTGNLNMRNDANTNSKILVTIPKDTKVNNHGYYKTYNNVKWYYVQVTINNITYTGFCSSKYLEKVS